MTINYNSYFTSLIIYYLLIQVFKCQLVYNSDPQFVFYNTTVLKKYNENNAPPQQIDYSSKKFKSKPKIILGISHYDNESVHNERVDFQLLYSDVTEKDCKVYVGNNTQNTKLGVYVTMLAIDTEQVPFINTYETQTDLRNKTLKEENDNLIYDEAKTFSQSHLKRYTGKRNVSVFLTGFRQSVFNGTQERMYVSIMIVDVTESTYKIRIIQNKKAIKVEKVYYSVIEYVEQVNSNYGLFMQQDEQYKNETFDINKKYEKVLNLTQNINNMNPPSSNFFTSINHIDFKTKPKPNSNIRIKLNNMASTQNQLKFQYETWADSFSYGVASSTLFFYEKQCLNQNQDPQNQYKLFENQCLLPQQLPENIQCDQFKCIRPNNILVEKECHFSCSKCTVPQSQYECIECSSDTRQLSQLTGSCNCKQGYIENGKSDCEKEKTIEYHEQIQSITTNFVQALYILYLPQLFINIHPFGDTFIFEMQQIGNFHFLIQNNSTNSYKYLTMLNFFNIFYHSEIINEHNVIENVFGINYKTVFDKYAQDNLIIVSFVFIFLSLVSVAVYAFRSQFNNQFYEENLLWNSQMKIIRISSNYFLAYIFLNLTEYSVLNNFSFLILCSILIIYIINSIICLRKSNSIDEEKNYRYLFSNLCTKLSFHRNFWTIYEIKKILLTSCLSFNSIQAYMSLTVFSSVAFIILLLKFKPYKECIRDYIYLIFSQFFMIFFSVLPLGITRLSKNIIEQNKVICFMDILIMIYTICQFCIFAEYRIRYFLQQLHKKKQNKIRSNSEQNIMVDFERELEQIGSPYRNSFVGKRRNISADLSDISQL